VRDVFAFVEDMSLVEVAPLAAAASPVEGTSGSAETSAECSSDDPAEAAVPAPPHERAPATRSVAEKAGLRAETGTEGRAPGACAKQAAPGRSTVRVDTAKIDKLIDLVGELVIAQWMVNAALDGFGGPAAEARLREAVLAMDRNTRELQDRILAVRMLPIGSVFNRFSRMVRDLSGTLGKRVNLVVSGDEVELDKRNDREARQVETGSKHVAVHAGQDPLRGQPARRGVRLAQVWTRRHPRRRAS